MLRLNRLNHAPRMVGGQPLAWPGLPPARALLLGVLTALLLTQLFVLTLHLTSGLYQVFWLSQTIAYLLDPTAWSASPTIPALLLVLGASANVVAITWAAELGCTPSGGALRLGALGGGLGALVTATLGVCCAPLLVALVGSALGGLALIVLEYRSWLLTLALFLQLASLVLLFRQIARAAARARAQRARRASRPEWVLVAANLATAALLVFVGTRLAPTPPAARTGSVLVHLVDSRGNPLSGAAVMVEGPFSFSWVRTDGLLPLGALPPGHYRITAQLGDATSETEFDLAAGANEHIVLVLHPARTTPNARRGSS
ncbi:MAG: hypothetical protein KatS3mg061_0086 [Dehalococcoidia bacterium]|nr:MAG: hypothetical protein KatS3mg061_0086 [Dehalococcoidia bacterium]